MRTTDETAILRLEVDGKWSIKELAECFQSLRYAHASIDVFLRDVNRDDLPRRPPNYTPPKRFLSRDYIFYRFIYPEGKTASGTPENPLAEYYKWHREYTLSHLWPDDDLFLHAIQIESPGWAEIIGTLNPLTFIKDCLVMMRDWREQRRHLALENQLLENQVLRERIAILKEAGYTEQEIKDFINDHIRVPLNEIQRYQEKKLIIGAEIKQLPPG
jgi:hypothetical protein